MTTNHTAKGAIPWQTQLLTEYFAGEPPIYAGSINKKIRDTLIKSPAWANVPPKLQPKAAEMLNSVVDFFNLCNERMATRPPIDGWQADTLEWLYDGLDKMPPRLYWMLNDFMEQVLSVSPDWQAFTPELQAAITTNFTALRTLHSKAMAIMQQQVKDEWCTAITVELGNIMPTARNIADGLNSIDTNQLSIEQQMIFGNILGIITQGRTLLENAREMMNVLVVPDKLVLA
jgi:hypothetical protein